MAIPLKIESPGPLFFKQKRVGLNGRYFYIHKHSAAPITCENFEKLVKDGFYNGLI